MRTSRAHASGTFRDEVAVSDATYNEAVWDVLDRVYGPLRHAAELLARHAKATPKAARNWLSRECAPNGESLLHLMAQCPELHDRVNRVVAERRAAVDAAMDRAAGLNARMVRLRASHHDYFSGETVCGSSSGPGSVTADGTNA